MCHKEKLTLSEKIRELILKDAKNQLEVEIKEKKIIKKTLPTWKNSQKKRVFTVGEM